MGHDKLLVYYVILSHIKVIFRVVIIEYILQITILLIIKMTYYN